MIEDWGYQRQQRNHRMPDGQDIVTQLGGLGPQTSRTLKEAGIPGIRYLDQGSRGAGNGTRNYVVFDDSLINILAKY
jgi:hypothetical protein